MRAEPARDPPAAGSRRLRVTLAGAARREKGKHQLRQLVRMLWDEFQRLGVCMLNPLQPELQPVDEFKRRYHGTMGVFGGLPTGDIHRMDAATIRATVRDLFEKTGRGGGLIMSTHDIDYAVTEHQLAALVGAMKECVY